MILLVTLLLLDLMTTWRAMTVARPGSTASRLYCFLGSSFDDSLSLDR